MQESIQAEIAKTAREAAEKHGCKPRISCQHAPAPLQASDEDDEDDRSFMVLGQHHRISRNRHHAGSTRIQGWVR